MKITCHDPDATSWANKSQPTVKEPKSMPFEEMINAIHNSNINSSDSEDDFVQSFKPINTDLYFDILDEPTESEKPSVQAKNFLSDSFGISPATVYSIVQKTFLRRLSLKKSR